MRRILGAWLADGRSQAGAASATAGERTIAGPSPGFVPSSGWLAAALFGLGAGLAMSSILIYALAGYSRGVLLLWLAGLGVLGVHFLRLSERLPRLAAIDVVAPAALTLAFVPLYVIDLHRFPVVIGADEVTSILGAKLYTTHHVDLFRLTDYLLQPALGYVGWSWLGKLLGGGPIDFTHLRLLSGLVGLAAIGLSYAFFRQLLPRPWALFAAAVMGLNHSFIVLSRFAVYWNTVVPVEMAAMALLLLGLRRGHAFATFSGGVLAGLGFYLYFPARAVFLLWLLFLLLLALWLRRELAVRKLARIGSIAAVGFALTAAPAVVSDLTAPAWVTEHSRGALLVFSDGRKLQREWVGASSEWGGIKTNAVNALGAFNSNLGDRAYQYINPGHGFVDPLTGGLLWAGVAVLFVRLIRRRDGPLPLVVLSSFFALWLSYAFLIGQAPDFTRMFLILPFVAYLVAEAVRSFGRLFGRLVPRLGAPAVATLALAAVAAIGIWNGVIVWDYIRPGLSRGNDIGSTGRYIEAHRDVPDKTFYIAADERKWAYYDWGTPTMWQERMRVFAARDSQIGGVIDPSVLGKFSALPPFRVFMRGDLWSQVKSGLTARYPQARIRDITPDGRLVVLEVPRRSTA